MTVIVVLAVAAVVGLVVLVAQSLRPALLTSRTWSRAAASRRFHLALANSWEIYLVLFGVVGVVAWIIHL